MLLYVQSESFPSRDLDVTLFTAADFPSGTEQTALWLVSLFRYTLNDHFVVRCGSGEGAVSRMSSTAGLIAREWWVCPVPSLRPPAALTHALIKMQPQLLNSWTLTAVTLTRGCVPGRAFTGCVHRASWSVWDNIGRHVHLSTRILFFSTIDTGALEERWIESVDVKSVRFYLNMLKSCRIIQIKLSSFFCTVWNNWKMEWLKTWLNIRIQVCSL